MNANSILYNRATIDSYDQHPILEISKPRLGLFVGFKHKLVELNLQSPALLGLEQNVTGSTIQFPLQGPKASVIATPL